MWCVCGSLRKQTVLTSPANWTWPASAGLFNRALKTACHKPADWAAINKPLDPRTHHSPPIIWETKQNIKYTLAYRCRNSYKQTHTAWHHQGAQLLRTEETQWSHHPLTQMFSFTHFNTWTHPPITHKHTHTQGIGHVTVTQWTTVLRKSEVVACVADASEQKGETHRGSSCCMTSSDLRSVAHLFI